MKFPFLIGILILLSTSCSDEQFLLGQEVAAEAIQISLDTPTRIKLIHEMEEDFYWIHSMSIDTQEFKDFEISQGASKEFKLNDVKLTSYEDLSLSIQFSSSTRTLSETATIDLNPGGITLVWLTGREGCGGCGGHSIEWGWED